MPQTTAPPDATDAPGVITIRNRWTGATIYSGAHATMREAVEAAVKAGADLAGANLAGADLADANLAGAYLAGAYLADAYFAGAYLAGANLAGAYFAGANLADAYLADAYLVGANLAGANLADAYLVGANLAGACFAGANLADANLVGANLANANLAGAYLAGAKFWTKAGDACVLRAAWQAGPLGSRRATLTIYSADIGMLAQTGCFSPAPVEQFLEAVAATHGDNQHGRAYRAAVECARIALEVDA